MALKLIRPDVEEKYICNVDKDVVIHAKGYSGKLSNVNLSGADHLVKSKSGYLTEKEAGDKKKLPVSDNGQLAGEVKADKKSKQ